MPPRKPLCGNRLRSTPALIPSGRRRQVRRRFDTERAAREGLPNLAHQVSIDAFVPRKSVTVEELCADWLASLHNARAATLNAYRFSLAPLRERHGDLPVRKACRELSHNVVASMKKVPRVRREMATYTPDEIRRVPTAASRCRISSSRTSTASRLSTGADVAEHQCHVARRQAVRRPRLRRRWSCAHSLGQQSLRVTPYSPAR